MSQARANCGSHELRPRLKQAVEAVDVLPTREPSQFARPERRPQEARELSIAGPHRRRPRPKTQENQEAPSSGKHKPPRDKKGMVVNAKTKRGGYLSQTSAGKIPAKKLVATEAIGSPRAALLDKDPGFQGYEPDVAQTHQPKQSRARESYLVGKSGTSGNGLGFGFVWSLPLPGETVSQRERLLAQDEPGLRRLGQGRGLGVTQSPRSSTQTLLTHLKENSSA